MAGQLRFATRRRADFTGCHVGTRLARVLVDGQGTSFKTENGKLVLEQ